MKWRLAAMLSILFAIGGAAVAGIVWNSQMPMLASAAEETPETIQQAFDDADEEVEDVLEDVLDRRREKMRQDTDADLGDQKVINVLVLGLDARKGMENPHCDAIHMFSLDTENWTIEVTSVPRGTYAYIPPGTFAENEYYLANACYFAGVEYGISQIERISGKKADYVATVGFSQVYGILRTLQLPTAESLQWLRNRQTYAIGDPQRSHNQAVFMADLILRYIDQFEGALSVPLQRVIYSFVDTDMDFGTVRALVKGYAKSGLSAHPERITLQMRPQHETRDLHFDIDNPDEQIEDIKAFLSRRLSKEDFSGRSLDEFQHELLAYLHERLGSREPIDDIVEKRLWLQIEDEAIRESIHLEILERRLSAMESPREAVTLLTDFILEKEVLGVDDSVERAKELLEEWMEQLPPEPPKDAGVLGL